MKRWILLGVLLSLFCADWGQAQTRWTLDTILDTLYTRTTADSADKMMPADFRNMFYSVFADTNQADPTVNDDSTKGYDYNSYWLNLSNGKLWRLKDPTAGAAVWDDLTDAETLQGIDTLNIRNHSPQAHATTHQSGGGDQLDHDNLGNLGTHTVTFVDSSRATSQSDNADSLASNSLSQVRTHTPQAHAASHTDGTDDIQNATSGQKGLMTSTDKSKLDGIENNADVTDATNVQSALTSITDPGEFLKNLDNASIIGDSGLVAPITVTVDTALHPGWLFQWIYVNSSSDVTLQIATEADSSYPQYAEYFIRRQGTGNVIIEALTGVTLNSKFDDAVDSLNAQHSPYSLRYDGDDSWWGYGDGK